ncbi:asparaginase [Erythrobacteraceae bacterium CFH 75059]|uniref:asparaginase n=1 Tax=Qipengyuania thermophila TaxID=2509361 RepID=UPI0010218131|nr:asparaginase [Qipengyuania thermophila]TCD02284.1 asparaginase [Erythrobacteraceae bacterium CFH 75059]
MTASHLLVLATGGTIAGRAGSATARSYLPGQIDIAELLARVAPLVPGCTLRGRQLAAIGSEDITTALWRLLWEGCTAAMDDPLVDGVIITHGTDTAEETAMLLDLTLPTTKPVVLVGAMRPSDAVGSDGLRNFVNAVQVAGDAAAAGRGVLLVMGDKVLAARDARKARTSSLDAFRGYPRDGVALVTPHSLDWFGAPWAVDRPARYGFPERFPRVPVLYAHAQMDAAAVTALARDAAGVVLAGVGEGNAPQDVRRCLAGLARAGVVVVRSSRVDEGAVERDERDEADGFVAARTLGPAKARIVLQVLLASGVRDPAGVQRAFDAC